ncbi:MAG: hypothetical protein WKF88_02755 [Ferruginibacter sp.]
MIWEKKGLIFDPKGKLDWATDSALQPTPVVLEDRIRIFCGCRDAEGISRIGWVDVDTEHPETVLGYSQVPALDIGLPGCFDDNGVVPTAVVQREGKLFLYYAGYQLVKNVRFIAFTGLAVSDDHGISFKRFKNTPVLERSTEEFLFRAIHTIFYDEGKWKVWYGAGSSFIDGSNKSLPVYNIRYMESADGITFPDKGSVVLNTALQEHRVGRPYVIKSDNKYLMFFGASTDSQAYRLAYAESADGINWQRKDQDLGIGYKEGEFDSDMSAYPALVMIRDRMYLFYNGNEYGKEGFGLALLTKNIL